jgi:hypothetical protein
MGIVAAWAKTAVPAMIAMAGASEIAESGSSTVARSIPHIAERVEEIQKAWGAVSNPADFGKALLSTMNL